MWIFDSSAKLESHSFLKVNCSVKSEYINVHFIIILKSIYLSCTLSGFLTHELFCNIGHLENIVSLNYADFPNVDTLHYVILKIHANITTNFIKIFKYWGAVKLLVADTCFLEIEFSFECLNFIIGRKYW